MYAAQLTLPFHFTHEERRNRVFKVASQMRLIHVMESRIGDSLRRGISCGEQKRLSIAMELLSEPDIMMLDEPTVIYYSSSRTFLS